MTDILELLQQAVAMKASDLHISVGVPPIYRVNGILQPSDEGILTDDHIKDYLRRMLSDEQFQTLDRKGELDFAFSLKGIGRFRVNAYKQRGSFSLAIRMLRTDPPSIEELGLPPVVASLADMSWGLVLVTGPTGSGKSTTLAAMIDRINTRRSCHIITMEDPIEYLHRHKKSIVNQREIGSDSESYATALRAALREDPDVILVGEMRDLETIAIAITAAETGHLVLSTLHTIGAAKTIDRIIDVFPPYQQQQIRLQLSVVLQGVISQQLLPRIDGNGRLAAIEAMVVTPAIRNLIREGKTYQIINIIQTNGSLGMKTMDRDLYELYRKGAISYETALRFSIDTDEINRYMGKGDHGTISL